MPNKQINLVNSPAHPLHRLPVHFACHKTEPLFSDIPRNQYAAQHQEDLEAEVTSLQVQAKAKGEDMARDNAQCLNEYLGLGE